MINVNTSSYCTVIGLFWSLIFFFFFFFDHKNLNWKNSGKPWGEIRGLINEYVILKNYKVRILVIHQNRNILNKLKHDPTNSFTYFWHSPGTVFLMNHAPLSMLLHTLFYRNYITFFFFFFQNVNFRFLVMILSSVRWRILKPLSKLLMFKWNRKTINRPTWFKLQPAINFLYTFTLIRSLTIDLYFNVELQCSVNVNA